MCRGKFCPLECGQRRLGLGWPHIGPQNPAALDKRIGFQLDPLAEAAFRRFRRHVHALPGVVIFPAVIGAAQPVLFIAAEPQRNAAMRTELIDQRVTAADIAPGKQALGKDLYTDGRTFVFRQFLGKEDGNPIAAQQVAHRRSRANPRKQFALFMRQHSRIRLAADLQVHLPSIHARFDGAGSSSNSSKGRGLRSVAQINSRVRERTKQRESGRAAEGGDRDR